MNRVQTPRSRLVITIFFSLFCWLLVGLSSPDPGPSVFAAYLVANLPFIALAIALLLCTKYLIARPLLTLVTDRPTFQYGRFASAFILYSICALLFLIIGALRHPGTVRYNPAPTLHRLLFIALALVITPIQTSGEELLFRILPVRLFFPAKLRPNILVSLASALLFTLPHLSNQEVALSANKASVLAYYALFGFGVTAICLATGGFEVALAVHAANNLHVALICNYHNSSLPSIPLFYTDRSPGGWLELAQLFISLGIVGLSLYWQNKNDPSQSPRPTQQSNQRIDQ